MWTSKSWLANGSPARTLSLGRRLFMVNVVSFHLPNAMPFIPHATGPMANSWPCGLVPEYLVLCQKVLRALSIGHFKCLGSDQHRLRISRVLRSRPKLALIKMSDDTLSVWGAIINNVSSYFLFPREMYDKKSKNWTG